MTAVMAGKVSATLRAISHEDYAYLKDDVGAIRDVDNAFEQIPLSIQNSFFEDVFGGVRDGQNDDERDDHGKRFEGEQLTVRGQICGERKSKQINSFTLYKKSEQCTIVINAFTAELRIGTQFVSSRCMRTSSSE